MRLRTGFCTYLEGASCWAAFLDGGIYTRYYIVMADFYKGTKKLATKESVDVVAQNLETHTTDTTIHATAVEKGMWDEMYNYVTSVDGMYETNEDGQTYLTDEYIASKFGFIKAAQPGCELKKYGIEWAAWPDLSTAITGTQVTPWRQTVMSNPPLGIRKLDDNIGLVAHFHEYGISTGNEQDDYVNLPAFMWWPCNYIKDKHGTTRVTAIKGMTAGYEETGSVDVGVLSMCVYVKYEKTVNSDESEFSREEFGELYNKYGGVPVHRFWISLTKHDDTWHPVSPSVRWDGEEAPYVVRCPYLVGEASDGIWRSQPGLLAINGVSYTSVWNYYVRDASKGVGYMGGTIETRSWGWLMCMLKYGVKSSQELCVGISSAIEVYAAETRTELSDTFPVLGQNGIYPGMYVNLRSAAGVYPTQNQDVYEGVLSAKVLSVTKRTDSEIYDVKLDVDTEFAIDSTSVYIQQGWSRAGMTNIIPGTRDGCIGSSDQAWSAFRLQGIEYGQGMSEIIGDAMNCTVDGKPHMFMRDKNAQNHTGENQYSWDVATSIFVDMGEMSQQNAGIFPVEFLFSSIISGDVNYGDNNSYKYVNGGIWPSNEPTYQPSAGDSVSYGDYYWCAITTNGQYEILLGGYGADVGKVGLLRLGGGLVLSNAGWTLASRD